MSVSAETMTKAYSDDITIFLEGNEQVYPCRCGETHRGEYGFYDYFHHTCDHDEVLMLHEDIGYCIACGKTISIIDKRGEINGYQFILRP